MARKRRRKKNPDKRTSDELRDLVHSFKHAEDAIPRILVLSERLYGPPNVIGEVSIYRTPLGWVTMMGNTFLWTAPTKRKAIEFAVEMGSPSDEGDT
jgi:hypothetical protein